MRFRLLLAGVVALLALAAPAAASTSTGKCISGHGWSPTCTFWTGTTTNVADGDTIDVDIDGDGTHRAYRVRFTGINTMELSVYSHTPSRRRGDCHAVAATARLERLIRQAHGRVRLAAQDPRSRSGDRLRRHVSLRLGGKWVDVGRVMLAEGWALWLSQPIEYAWNRGYAATAERAAAKRLRLWNPHGCGAGPAASLAMTVEGDPPGPDHENNNGEWARIANTGTRAVSLHRWWFRDGGNRRYTFPARAVIPAGGAITLHIGHGTDTRDTFYWGLSIPPLDNPSIDDRATGDGGYLFDPRGNVREWVMYH